MLVSFYSEQCSFEFPSFVFVLSTFNMLFFSSVLEACLFNGGNKLLSPPSHSNMRLGMRTKERQWYAWDEIFYSVSMRLIFSLRFNCARANDVIFTLLELIV